MKASWQASTASHEKLHQRQNRYDFSFNYPFKIKHAKRINIFVVLQHKSNKQLSKKTVYFDDIIISSLSSRISSLYA